MRKGQGRRAAARRMLAMTTAVVAVAAAVAGLSSTGASIFADVVWM